MPGDGNFFWWWAVGTRDPEVCTGPCDSREQAIAEARGNDGNEEGFIILEADRMVPSTEIFDADDVLGRYGEVNEECWSEDSFDLECSREQERDLESMLNETFAAWFEKHGIGRGGWAFHTVRNKETFQPVGEQS